MAAGKGTVGSTVVKLADLISKIVKKINLVYLKIVVFACGDSIIFFRIEFDT